MYYCCSRVVGIAVVTRNGKELPDLCSCLTLSHVGVVLLSHTTGSACMEKKMRPVASWPVCLAVKVVGLVLSLIDYT